jgi:hypothetical protein
MMSKIRPCESAIPEFKSFVQSSDTCPDCIGTGETWAYNYPTGSNDPIRCLLVKAMNDRAVLFEKQIDWPHRYALEEVHFQLQKAKKAQKILCCPHPMRFLVFACLAFNLESVST